MAITLGEKLRQAREAKGMELRDVADNTRIALNYLASIEENNYKPLPGGIFNKGFVRSFAKIVGVDEKEALADYSNLMAQQGISTSSLDDQPTRRSEVLTNDSGSGSPFVRIIMALIVLSVVGAGIYYGVSYLRDRAAQTPAAAPSPTPENAVNAPAQTTPTPAAPVAASLNVQIKAAGEDVFVNYNLDNGKNLSVQLKPDETKELNAQQSVKVRYSKYKAGAMTMIINGRAAKVQSTPANPKAQAVEMEITRENYAQLLQ